MKNSDNTYYAPILIGLAGSFLPYAAFHIPPERFTSFLADTMAGRSCILILFLYGIFAFILKRKEQLMPRWITGLVGFYLLGFSLFRLYHTLIIFRPDSAPNLAAAMKVSAYPREGIFLLLACAILFLLRSLSKRPDFSTLR